MMRKGFTLVEIIIAVIVIGVAFIALISALITLTVKTAQIETIDKKVYLAQEKMEEYLTRSFAGVTAVGETNFPGAFSSYKYAIVVNYVATSELNNSVAGPTPFKNVKVMVWSGVVDPNLTVEVVSVVSTYEIK